MGSCRAATITGTLSRISLNDEEEEKGPEGLNYSTLPGNIMSKVLIQQPSGLHMSMGVGDLGDQCMDSTADMRRTVYLCTDDATRQSEQELSAHDLSGHPQPGQMETDYIVLPRSSAAVSASGSSSVPTLLGHSGMEHMGMEQQYPIQTEHMQNLPFEPRTAVKNFLFYPC